MKANHNSEIVKCSAILLCQRSLNHKMKANHNTNDKYDFRKGTVSKIVKSQNESKSQQVNGQKLECLHCVKDR